MDEYIKKLTALAKEASTIDPNLYDSLNVKRGLRYKNGTGVLVGLTRIGAVHGYTMKDENKILEHGRLYYRDYELNDLIKTISLKDSFAFEKCIFLILFGKLPNKEEFESFLKTINSFANLPKDFTENFILRDPSNNIMNLLQRTILCLYSLDDNPDDTSLENLIKQSINIIAKMPSLITYSYRSIIHNFYNGSLVLHRPREDYGIAENILYMLKENFTTIEKETLNLCLIIHAEHGGGNNSTFTSHVVSSSGTDTYSTISASIGSLKGPKHGGANIKVKEMIDFILENTKDINDEKELRLVLKDILDKKTFDKSGLIYGMGHAIYTLSDPRALLLKEKSLELAKEKNKEDLFYFYESIENISRALFKEQKGDAFEICANVDLYSGLVYNLLDIPESLYTPLFATARVASWNAHRIEQIVSDKKIIRPAYKTINSSNNLIK